MQVASDVAPKLRRDAQRNRQLLIEAATEVLSEHGLDAPLDEIARRAGVGNATLYRRFPTRDDLYEAVFAKAGDDLREIGDRVLAIKDGWTALTGYLDEVCTFMATDRGLCDLMTERMPRSPALNEIRIYADNLVKTLLERAQRQGTARADIGLPDLILVMCSLQRVIPAVDAVAPDAWRRHLALTLDALRPAAASPLPPPALTYEQLVELAPNFAERPRSSAQQSN
ncbi:MAG TPA: helix-turn-helix domain-containing protein [Pseudonocardia sp.]|jgi:AcrR family transcriptional regulator